MLTASQTCFNISQVRTPRERLLAVHMIGYLQEANRIPEELKELLIYTVFSDRPEIAAAAQVALGINESDVPRRVILSELLAPLISNFRKTKELFDSWGAKDIWVEEVMHERHTFSKDLLINKQHLIPADLVEDAKELVNHYDAWLKKYDEIRPNGVRDPEERFVFVGIPPINKPFPDKSEKKFVALYHKEMAAYRETLARARLE